MMLCRFGFGLRRSPVVLWAKTALNRPCAPCPGPEMGCTIMNRVDYIPVNCFWRAHLSAPNPLGLRGPRETICPGVIDPGRANQNVLFLPQIT